MIQDSLFAVPDARPPSRWPSLALPIAALLLVMLTWLRSRLPFPLMQDDAFIFARYADHLASGWGFVWNEGEAPVEGFTSFGYLMLLAGLQKLGLPLVALMPWLGVGCAIGALAVTWRLMESVNPEGRASNAVALMLLAICPPWLFWASSGMETPLFALTLAVAALAFVRYREGRVSAPGVGVMWTLCALTRPEAVALFALVLLFDALTRRDGRGAARMALPFLVLFGAYFVWRWQYFGFLMPNTYYAKTGAGLVQVKGGTKYLLSSLSSVFSGGALPMLLLAALSPWPRRESRTLLWFLAVVAVGGWGLVALNGGDHFKEARFLVPTLPFVFAMAAAGFTFAARSLKRLPRVGALLIVMLLALWNWRGSDVYRSANNGVVARAIEPRAIEGRVAYPHFIGGFAKMGQALARQANPRQSIACVPIGAIGYYSQMRVVDMVGIVNPAIGHQPFDRRYTATWRPGHDKGDGRLILSRRPDFIQLVDVLTARPQPIPDARALQYKSVAELWASPQFRREYEFKPLRVEGGWFYNLYRRRRQGLGVRAKPRPLSSSLLPTPASRFLPPSSRPAII